MTDPTRVLIADPRDGYVDRLAAALRTRFEAPVTAERVDGPDAALERIEAGGIACLVSAGAFPDGRDGLDLLAAVRESAPEFPVVLFPEDGSEALAGRAVAAGVTEYVPRSAADPPIDRLADRVRAAVSTDGGTDRAALYEIAGDPGGSSEDQIRRLLEIGLERLDVEHAYFGRIDETADVETVVATAGEPILEPGQTVPVAKTFCRRTVRADEPVAAHDMGNDPDWADDPAYRAHPFECYFGATVTVDGEPFGAVCFVDRTPRARAFDEAERTFIELLARLASHRLDRQQYERRLERRNERLQERQRDLRILKRALDEAAVGVTVADATEPDTPITYVNDAFEAVTGYSAEAAIGRNCRFLQGPGTDPETVATVAEAIEAGRAVSVEITNYRANGEPFWNQLTITPVRDATGEVIRYIGFQEDVTERKRRIGRLEASEERFRSIVETAYDPVFRLDDTGTITYVSPAFESVTGYEPDAIVGSDMRTLLPPDSMAAATGALGGILEGESVENLVLRVRRRDGSITMAEVRATPIRREGEVVGAQGILREIADRERRRRTLSVLNRVFRHNLRNETNVLLAHAGRIADSTDEEAVAESAEVILDRTRQLVELSEKAQTLRSVSERDAPTEVDVATVAGAVADEVATEHPEVSVSVEAPDSATAIVDPAIHDGIVELCTNAVEHNDPSDLSIGITVTVGDDRVRVAVADDGCGIPDVEHTVLNRAEETPLEHGSGLGLRLVDEIVANAGGNVEIVENDPTGTVLTLVLPRPEEADIDAPGPVVSADDD